MSPVTHGLLSWIGSNLVSLGRRERGILVASGIIPDLDGLGIISGPEYYIRSPHIPFHNILAGFLAIRAPIEFFSADLDLKVVGVFKKWFGGNENDQRK